MLDYNNAVSLIRDNGGFKHNKDDSSFYRTYMLEGSKPIQVRISNHGTHLWTWDKKGEYVPSYAINICVVFMSSSKGYIKPNTLVEMDIKDNNGNVIGRKKDYEVVEYVYDCDKLSIEDCGIINKEVTQIPSKRKFDDPFSKNPTKRCSIYRLRPNQNPEIITESNNYKNMRRKTITESQLRNIVAESVKNALRESIVDGPDTFGCDSIYSDTPSDEEIKRGAAFDAKYCPWKKWPDAQTLEGLIECAYFLRRDFDSGKYSYNRLICDLYNMLGYDD